MRYFIGKVFEWLRLPGVIRPFRYYDKETGQTITLRTSPYYTVLVVGEKEYFFVRESGKLDGHGKLT